MSRPPSSPGAATPAREAESGEVTILLADLRGFTAVAEAQSARTVLEVLNRYFARMCEIAYLNGGTVDKFIGDAVMVLFGAPQRRADDPLHAVTCAVQMQIAMDEVNRDQAARGLPPLYMGAGINTGQVVAGLLGPERHREYTVIGSEVNTASRIESFSLRGQVLISEATFDRCRGFVNTGPPMDVRVKGKSQPVRLREVLGIPARGLQIPQREVRRSPRVEVRIPLAYETVVDKIVVPPRRNGVMLDLGYQGLRAEIEPGLVPQADMLLEFDLSLVGSRAREVYAKVRHVRREHGRSVAGIEFTSVSEQVDRDIRYFVQLLMQGSSTK